MARNLKIDADRLWSTIMASAEIGRGPKGGLRRLSLTDDARDVRDLLAGWARDGGFGLKVDGLGNMFIRREGREPGLAPVLIGKISVETGDMASGFWWIAALLLAGAVWVALTLRGAAARG